MEEVVYQGGRLAGSVNIPPSKSAAHRAILCAALSGKPCVVSNLSASEDMKATIGAIKALGCDCAEQEKAGTLQIKGREQVEKAEIHCLESGSTLRFLIPVAAALGMEAVFQGSGRLPQRPLGVYEDLLPAHGVKLRTSGGLPLGIAGRLRGGKYTLPGDVSSQFITGLMFALPLLEEDSEIMLSSPLESAGYVDLTIQILFEFGILVEPVKGGWQVPGRQRYRARDYRVEGDWSQAAFFLCMAALSPSGDPLFIRGLRPDSKQGDKACVKLFQQFGLQVEDTEEGMRAWNPNWREPFGGRKGISIDAAQIPDMVPALAVCGALSRGETRIFHAGRLRLKESDRMEAMQKAVSALGGRVVATADELILQGVPQLSGGQADGKNDHRIVMALAAASLCSKDPVRVTDAWSIRKSYPNFFEDFKSIGGIADVIHLG